MLAHVGRHVVFLMLATFQVVAAEPPECLCTTLPCWHDPRCANPDTDPFKGLGCNAEGVAECRFRIMDCDGDEGNAVTKQPCIESDQCVSDSGKEGCNAAGFAKLRFCSFGRYPACPYATPSNKHEKGVPPDAEWIFSDAQKTRLAGAKEKAAAAGEQAGPEKEATATTAEKDDSTSSSHMPSLLLPSAVAATDPPQISERNVLLPPRSTLVLSVRGGDGSCYSWTSDSRDMASIESTWCEGSSSYARILTTAELPPSGSSRAFIVAHPAHVDMAKEEEEEAEPLVCEVNVAEVKELQLLTVTRKMVAQELQWLQVAALDGRGNAFSLPGLRTMRFQWRFTPEGVLNLKDRRFTRQQLDEEHAALSDSEAETYFKVPVHAQPLTAGATVRVMLIRAPGARAPPVFTTQYLEVVPSSLTLLPSARAILAPGMELQYSLEVCSNSGECSAQPSFDTQHWSVHPRAVATVSGSGLLLGRAIGVAALHVSVPLQRKEVEVEVALPHQLRISLLRGCGSRQAADCLGVSDEAECGAWVHRAEGASAEDGCGGACCRDVAAERHGTLVVGSERLVRLTMLAKDRPTAPMLLPADDSHAPSHLRPTLELAGGSFSLHPEKALHCGRICSLDCPPNHAGGACLAPGGGGELPRPTCVCAVLRAIAPGGSTLTASLDASPAASTPGGATAATTPTAEWGSLQSSLELRVVQPLTLGAYPRRHPRVCRANFTAPTIPLPRLTGGSGHVGWAAQPADAAAFDSESATLEREGTTRLIAFDLHAPSNRASLEVDSLAISHLEIDAVAMELPTGSSMNATVLFASGGSALQFDVCDSLQLRWRLVPITGEHPFLSGDAVACSPQSTDVCDMASEGVASCHVVCPTDPKASCVLLRLNAVAAGNSELQVTLDTGCDGAPPLSRSLNLASIDLVSPQPLNLCAPSETAPVVHPFVIRAMLLPLPLQRVARLEQDRPLSLLLDVPQPEELSLTTAHAVEAGDAGEVGDIALEAVCYRPHEQVATLSAPFETSAAEPPMATLQLYVACSVAPSFVAPAPAAAALGDAVELRVAGGWAGADLQPTISFQPTGRDLASTGEDPATTEGAPAQLTVMATGSEVAPAWTVTLTPLRPGRFDIGLGFGEGYPDCSTSPSTRLEAGFGRFSISCPSQTVLPGTVMACYAIASSNGVPLTPSVDWLDLVHFGWSVAAEDASPVTAVTLRSVAPSSRDLGGHSFVVLVTASAVGSSVLSVSALSAGLSWTASFRLLVVEPISSFIAPFVPIAPSLLPPNSSLCLPVADEKTRKDEDGRCNKTKNEALSEDEDPPPAAVAWSFCGATAGSARLTRGGRLQTGASSGLICALASLDSPGVVEGSVPHAQQQPLIFEVAEVRACVRLRACACVRARLRAYGAAATVRVPAGGCVGGCRVVQTVGSFIHPMAALRLCCAIPSVRPIAHSSLQHTH